MENKPAEEKKGVVAGVEFNPPPPSAETAIKQRIADAQAAMAGPERVAQWEQEEKTKSAKAERGELEKKLRKIEEQKDKMELGWIAWDDKRRTLSTTLRPILDEEKKLEEEETKLELEEAKTVVPTEKKAVEEKRWQSQTKRRTLEEQKWKIEANLAEIEKGVGEETKKYQDLLNEEDALKSRLQEIEKNSLS